MMGACKRAANNLYGKGFEIWHRQFTEDAIAEHDGAIHSLLVILLEEDKKGLATFNDDHDRTFAEVMQVFDTAIILTGGYDEESPS